MDRKKMLQALVPAGAAAAVVVLIGILISLSDWGGSSAGKPPGSSSDAKVEMNDAGMADKLPDVNAPEWKPGPGIMKSWDVKEGEGEPCPVGASVTIHYTGWTLEGSVFDSSRPRGEPATFGLNGLIKGWQEGIPGMKAGGIRRLYIPYDWAYGDRGSPPKIPPRADLVFEVKLLKFKK